MGKAKCRCEKKVVFVIIMGKARMEQLPVVGKTTMDIIIMGKEKSMAFFVYMGKKICTR
jgi:hypothetical protein